MFTNNKVIYPELSYKIVGLLYEIHTELGKNLQEKYYQRAVEEGLTDLHIPFRRELKADLYFHDKKIGCYFLDFLVDAKIVLELKAVPKLGRDNFRQVLSYLKVNDLDLGILVNFRQEKLEFHRVLNANK